MMKKFMTLLAALAIVSGCGASADVPSTIEPTAAVDEAVGAPYHIAVVQLSLASNTSKTLASFGTFPADIDRLSHGKTAVAMDFLGPFHATPAQIGCDGTSNHDGPLLRTKALALASASTSLGSYRHIWFVYDYDLQPACFIGGASGGNFGAGPGYTVAYSTGYVTQFVSNEVAVHEFLHGINGPGMNPHMQAVSCTSGALRTDNAGCTFTEISPHGVPQSAWALGDATFGQGSTTTFDENPIYKVFWNMYGWTPLSNVGNIPASVGTYSRTLYPGDGAIPPNGSWMTVIMPLPDLARFQYRDLYFEYRQHAQIGNNLEDRPGIYLYYEEQQPNPWLGSSQPYMFPTASLLHIGSNPANYDGLQPVPVSSTVSYAIPGEPNVTVQVPTACGATCQINVTVSGPVL